MTINQTSRRAVVRKPNGPESIELINVPIAAPEAGQVRVKVAAAAINPVDLGVVNGRFHAMGLVTQPKYTGLGWDFAGTIEAAGTGVDLAEGTHVAGFIAGFDRDFGSHADHVVVPATSVGLVPTDVGLREAATFPLNLSAASQLLDLLGDPPGDGRRLLVTGSAGAVGAHTAVLGRQRGWEVTGLARPFDEEFVRSLGVEFTADARPGWDAVADGAAMQHQALQLVRDGGRFVGVQPAMRLSTERGIAVNVVETHPDGEALTKLLRQVSARELKARVHATFRLTDIVAAYQMMATGNIRGRIILIP